MFWGRALAASALLLVACVAYLVYALPSIPPGDTALYARLSMAIPLIVATGYCGVRFSRERTRESEFSSSVPPGLADSA